MTLVRNAGHSWELTLHDEQDDGAWVTDAHQVRIIYVGGVTLRSYDGQGRWLETNMLNGRVQLPFAPYRFQVPLDVESEQSSNLESEPESDPSEGMSEAKKEPPVDSEQVPETVVKEEGLPHLQGELWNKVDPSNDEQRARSFAMLVRH